MIPEHASRPLAELQAKLTWRPPAIKSVEIEAALMAGRMRAAETLERMRREALHAWDDLDRLVLR